MIKKNKIYFGLWILGAFGVLTIFVAAKLKNQNSICSGINIEIANSDGNFFVSKNEVTNLIKEIYNLEETTIKDISTNKIEQKLLQNEWIKNVEVFFDNNKKLNIEIIQRKPIARIFTVYNTNCYIDNNGLRMPTKENATARVLVVTGFTSDNKTLSHVDSLLLYDVTNLSNYIVKDSFLNAQIAQINITNTGRFEFIPAVGEHIVEFGDATNFEDKFKRLYTFYTKAWLKNGLNNYEKIDVRFSNQVVATKVGGNKIDSIMQPITIDSVEVVH